MKRLIFLTLAILLMLSGCSKKQINNTDTDNGLKHTGVSGSDDKNFENTSNITDNILSSKEKADTPNIIHVSLEENHKTVDLDKDGKPEKVSLSMSEPDNELDKEAGFKKASLIINDEEVVKELGLGYIVEAQILDLDTSDSRLEIFVSVIFEAYADIKVFYYENGELSQIYFTDNMRYLREVDVIEAKGDGSIILMGETEFTHYEDEDMEVYRDLGQLMINVKYKLIDNFLAFVGTDNDFEASDMWKKESPYVLYIDELPVYPSVEDKQELFKIKKGETFFVDRIRLFEPKYSAIRGETEYSVCYAKIRTQDGRNGWIEVPTGSFYSIVPGDDIYTYHWG